MSQMSDVQPVLASLLKLLPVDNLAKGDVLARVSNASRTYHDASHLAALWRCHCKHAAAAGLDALDLNRLIACAIAYHDLIHDSRRDDSEVLSAAEWRRVAERCGIALKEIDWVAGTILATQDHLSYSSNTDVDPAGEALRVWFLDLDLSPLGATPATFQRNAQMLRLEASHMIDASWTVANLAFLRKMDAAPRIFRTPVLFESFEERARANIAAAIAQLAAINH